MVVFSFSYQFRSDDPERIFRKHKYFVKRGRKKRSIMLDEDLLKKKPFEGLFHGMTLFVSLFLFFFFYCKSLFDCWKNQVIQGIKSHHEPDLEQLAEINFF